MSDPRAELTDVVRDLADTGARLDRLGDEKSVERKVLEERRDELRARAARLREAIAPGRARAQLVAELRVQQRRLDDLGRKRIDVVRQAGGGSSGGDFGFATDAWRLNRAIDAAAGREMIEKRIAELRERLEELPDA